MRPLSGIVGLDVLNLARMFRRIGGFRVTSPRIAAVTFGVLRHVTLRFAFAKRRGSCRAAPTAVERRQYGSKKATE